MKIAAGSTSHSTSLGVQVGLVVAAAKIPETFAPGLAPRSAVDQGLVTGLSTGVHYLLALGAQDALQAAAAEIARIPAVRPLGRRRHRPAGTRRCAADLAAIPVGLALQRSLPSRPGEAMARGALRQVGWRAATTGVAAISLEAVAGGPAGRRRPAGCRGQGGLAARSPSRSGS